MSVATRSIKELVPIAVGTFGILLFLGLEVPFIAPFAKAVVALSFALFGVVYGWLFVRRYGRNAVIFGGVVLCLLLLVYGSALLVPGAMWR